MARVLLAESDRQICTLIAGILSDCGHAVAVCANDIEAKATLTARAIDVVVTDLLLGDDGDNPLGRGCAALGIPTLTLSGRRYHQGRAAEKRPPALIEKPFRFADLQGILDGVAACSRPRQATDFTHRRSECPPYRGGHKGETRDCLEVPG